MRNRAKKSDAFDLYELGAGSVFIENEFGTTGP